MLRRLRESRNLTQAQLAERLGESQPTISRVESGASGCSAALLHRIAEALELDAIHRSELLAWAAHQNETRRRAA